MRARGSYEVPTALRGELVLLERKASDLARVVGTLSALRAQQEGQLLIGMPPKLYVESIRTLLVEAQAILEGKS